MSDSDIVQDFLAESNENLDRLDRELVGLERNPRDHAALDSVFRTIHTSRAPAGSWVSINWKRSPTLARTC